MLVADLAQALQVALRRDDHAGRAGDRLDDDGGNGGGVVQRDLPLQVLGQFDAVRRQALRERIARHVQRVADVRDRRQARAEPLAVVRQAAHRHAAEADAVVALLAADETGALAFAAHAVVGQGDLQCTVHGFRTGVAEEHLVEVAGRKRRQALCQLERQRRTHREVGREIQRANLLLHRLDDARAGVAGVAAPEAGGGIQHLVAVDVAVMHAGRAGQQPRPGLELPVGRERHPEVIERAGRFQILACVVVGQGGGGVVGAHRGSRGRDGCAQLSALKKLYNRVESRIPAASARRPSIVHLSGGSPENPGLTGVPWGVKYPATLSAFLTGW